jgi:preprotein translocase subunit YajC
MGDYWVLIPFIIIIIMFFVMTYFLAIRPQRRRQREHEELLSGLREGDGVITSGGILGEIDRIDEDTVVLKLEDGARLRVLITTILRKQ